MNQLVDDKHIYRGRVIRADCAEDLLHWLLPSNWEPHYNIEQRPIYTARTVENPNGNHEQRNIEFRAKQCGSSLS
jgi:hypothetical protein